MIIPGMIRRVGQWAFVTICLVSLLATTVRAQSSAASRQTAGIRQPAGIRQSLREGQQALAGHDLTAAERDFTRALQRDPQQAEAAIGLGEVAMQRGDWQGALHWLDQARQIRPGEPRIWLDRGLVYCNLRDFDQGLRNFRQLLRLQPSSRQGRYLAGVTALYTGDSRASLRYLSALEGDPPNRLEYYYDLSTAAQMESQNGLSEAMLQKLKESGDDSPAYHLLLGRAYLNHNQPEQALPELQKVAEAVPRLPLLHFTLGIAYQNLHQDDRARAEFEKDLEVAPENALDDQRLGELDSRAHRDSQARADERKALSLAPQLAIAQLELGAVDLRLKRYGEAEQALRQAIRLYPAGARAHYLLGQVLQRTGRPRQAQQEFAAATRREQQTQGKLQETFAGGVLSGTEGDIPTPTYP